MPKLTRHGYDLIPQVFSPSDLVELRAEADRISTRECSACLRHLCRKSEVFTTIATSPLLLDLIPKNLAPVRSILFNKTAEQNWPVAWHQDLTITVSEEKLIHGYGPWSFKDSSPHVQPPTQLLAQMATIRIHLDDTPASNGALKVIPKSHRHGKIPSEEIAQYCRQPSQTCACSAGDVLVMSPLILHSSQRSESPANRRVIHFEYAPLDLLHPHLSWFE